MYACATPLNFTKPPKFSIPLIWYILKQIHSFRVIFIFILYVVVFAIISFFPIKQKLLTLQEYNIIHY